MQEDDSLLIVIRALQGALDRTSAELWESTQMIQSLQEQLRGYQDPTASGESGVDSTKTPHRLLRGGG